MLLTGRYFSIHYVALKRAIPEACILCAVSAACRGSLACLLRIVRLLRLQCFLSLALSSVLENLRVRCPLHNLSLIHISEPTRP